MKQRKKKKSLKDDSTDLDARARATFAATAEENDEPAGRDRPYGEDVSNDDLKSYLEKVVKEVKKEERAS